MFNWKDRKYVNPRKKIFKNLDTEEILNLEVQDDEDNISEESDTPLTAHCLNMAQQELIDDMSKTYVGTNITANTVKGTGRINKVRGFCKQKTREGKNLWNDNEARLDYITYSNGIYSASDNDNRATLQYKIQQYNDSTHLGNELQVVKNITNTGIYYFTATKAENANTLRIANSGQTREFNLKYPLDGIKVGEKFTVVLDIIDITVGASKFKDVMLLKGDYTNKELPEYEPYGVMPSTNYPSKVNCLGDDENLFNGELELGIINGNTGANLSHTSYIRAKDYISVDELSDYKISTDNENIKEVFVFEYDKDYNYNLTTNKGLLLSNYLTTNKGTKYIRFRPNIQTTNTLIKFKVQEGEIATPWSPYNHGNVTNKSSNKNLFNKETVTNGYWLNESGNLVGSTGYCVSDFIEIKEGKEYFLPKRGTTRTKFFDKNKVALTNTWDIADYSAPFVAPTNAKYIRFSINTSIVDINTFQFEEGHIATEYVEHEGDEQVTYLKEPLRGLNGVYDELDLSKGQIIRRFTKVVLDGTENWRIWSLNAQNVERFFVVLSDNAGVQKGLSSHFRYLSGDEDKEHFRLGGTGLNELLLYVPLEIASTVDELKSYLAEQYANGTPVEIVYEPATPIIEHIDCSDKIKQFEGQTTIFNTEGAELECSLTNNVAIAQINQNLQKIEEMIAGLKAGE